jgi:ADP-ribose pyrophosphatase YjhB (NUDIX family)
MTDAVCALIYRGDKMIGVSRKDDPANFGLVGGKVDPGEDRASALRREIKEETGLNIIKGKLIFTRKDHGFMCYVYLCEVEGEISTNEKGVVKEVTWEELFNGHFGNFNRELYKSIYG